MTTRRDVVKTLAVVSAGLAITPLIGSAAPVKVPPQILPPMVGSHEMFAIYDTNEILSAYSEETRQAIFDNQINKFPVNQPISRFWFKSKEDVRLFFECWGDPFNHLTAHNYYVLRAVVEKNSAELIPTVNLDRVRLND